MFGATLKVFRYKYKFLTILNFDSESVVNTYLQIGCDPAGVWHSTVPLWCLHVHQKQQSNPSLATLLSAGAYRCGHPPSEPSTPACLPQHSSTPHEIPPQTHTFPKWDAPGTGWVFHHLHPSCPPPQALSPWILLWRRRWPSSLSLSPAVGGRREPPRCSPGVLSSSLHGVCAQASCSTWRHLVSSGCPSSAPVFFSTGPVQQVGYNPLPPKAGEAGKLKLFLQWNPVKWNTALVFYLKTPGAYFFKKSCDFLVENPPSSRPGSHCLWGVFFCLPLSLLFLSLYQPGTSIGSSISMDLSPQLAPPTPCPSSSTSDCVVLAL